MTVIKIIIFYSQMAYLSVLKICKLLFAVAGHSLVHMVADACQPDSTSTVSPIIHNQVTGYLFGKMPK